PSTSVHVHHRITSFCLFLHSPTTLLFFFFNDPATTEIYTLSLHDALPICASSCSPRCRKAPPSRASSRTSPTTARSSTSAASTADRKSTRLNSSHLVISYAVFCLKKKKKKKQQHTTRKQKRRTEITLA